MKSISEIFRDGNFYEEAKDETVEADENTKSCENTEVYENVGQNKEYDDSVNAHDHDAQNHIFKDHGKKGQNNLQDTTPDGKRRMYCPRCYSDFYVYNGICPECGAVLEEPLTEDEAEEFMEVLFSTRL